MPEWLIQLFAENPSYTYLLVALVFLLCGLGLPLPEEIVLVTAGYLCYQGHAEYWLMMSVCVAAILAGDLIPFMLGRMFGPRLLRLRYLRFVVNRERLAMFDRWFRRRGDAVILIARFIPGLRVVAFFTGGTMRMRWMRFLFLDICGILLVTPALVFVGWHFGDKIDETVAWIRQVETSILYTAGVGAGLFAIWYWLRRRARRRRLVAGPRETFVGRSRDPQPAAEAESSERPGADASTTGSVPAEGADAPGKPAPEPAEETPPGSVDGDSKN